jgi:hypothetical protein
VPKPPVATSLAASGLAGQAAACQDAAATMDEVRLLYQRHAGDLLRFARALLGDASPAEDAVADAFARVLDGGQAPPRSPPGPGSSASPAWSACRLVAAGQPPFRSGS